jgi:hypothetical protein
MPPIINDNLVLIGGESGTGKSASLRNIPKPEGVMYLNCESGKKLPFASKFQTFTITDPYQVYSGFEAAEKKPDVHTVVIDTLTFLMDMFESFHVIGAADTMAMWGAYQQFFKNLMQQYVSKSTKDVIFTGHVASTLNEAAQCMESSVPVKGALKKNGLEAFFSTVVATRKMAITELEDYKNDLLIITDEEQMLGFKHVYQTRVTKETVNSRIRSSMGMWSIPETFINNDAQLLMQRLRTYYA